MSMFKEKKAKFEMNLSGTKVSFETPTNFHRDFGYPEAFSSIVNVFDPGNYPFSMHFFSVYHLYMNYISGVVIKDNDGTMAMRVAVEKLADSNISINNMKQLQDILSENFKATYGNEKRKEIEVVDPHTMILVSFPSGKWLNYRYEVGIRDEIAYSIPFSSTHYLTVSFELILSGNDKRFIKKAKKHIQEIMNSFKITPP